MFDWIGDIVDAIGNGIREGFEFLGTQISNTIWNTMLRWFYETIYGAAADFFTRMGNMGAEIFDLDWVKATVAGLCLLSVRWLPYSMWQSNTNADGQISKQRRSIF